MDTKVNYAVIGAFVVILFACIILGIVWLSSGFSVVDRTTYAVYMQEAVTGLSLNAAVEYNGVAVGEVKSISLNQKNPHLVKLLINIQNDTPVTQGTVATLNTRGLTGITYLSLKDNGSNLAPLKKLPGQPYPVIKTSPSLFLQLDAALSRLDKSLSRVSDSIQTLLDKDNQKSIKQTLANIDRITQMIANSNTKLTTILDKTVQASQKFPQLMESGVSTMQILQKQTLPATNQVITNINNMANNFSIVSDELKTNPSIILRGRALRPLGPGEK